MRPLGRSSRPSRYRGGGSPISVVPSPDAKSAYVLTNGMGSISGIDLDSGVEVFRTDFSTTEKRIKQIFAMEISPDGSELFSMQLLASLGFKRIPGTAPEDCGLSHRLGSECETGSLSASTSPNKPALYVDRRKPPLCRFMGHSRDRPANGRGTGGV